MRITKVVLTLIVFAAPLMAQQPSAAANHPVSPSTAGQDGNSKLHASAMKFLEASDTRQRLEQSLDKLLTDGRQDLLKRNQGLDPRFADEWLKRMRLRVSLDEFVNATAQVYEEYFTSDELDELTHAQLAMKRGGINTLTASLGQKLKSAQPHIQREINVQTSLIGARVGKEVGQEIEKDHPEWGKDTGPPNPAPAKH
jgi:hypothetical protein